MADGQTGESGEVAVWLVVVGRKHACVHAQVHLHLVEALRAQEVAPSPNRATQMNV